MTLFSDVKDNVIFFPNNSLNFAHIKPITSRGAVIENRRCTLHARTGDATGSVANILGFLPLYLNHQNVVRVTLNVAFAPPQEGLVQLLGMGGSESGVFVGFDGLNFGMLHRDKGRRQHWVLKVFTPSVAPGIITMTILGTQHTLAVPAGLDPLTIMYMLANVGSLRDDNVQSYTCFDRVTIYSNESQDFSVFTPSIDFGSTGVTGQVTVNIAGEAGVDTWVYREDFNALSRHTVDGLSMTDMNVFEFSFSRWSTGCITFAMLNTLNNAMTALHEFRPDDALTFNTSIPYHPFVMIQNANCTGSHELRTSMASISSGTPASATNSTHFSHTFIADNITVTAEADTVIALMTCPRISAGQRNYLTACINQIKVNCSTPRPIRVKVIVSGLVSKMTASQPHLPWSCIRHATVVGEDTYVSGGLQFSSLYMRENSLERVINYEALWLPPGSNLAIAVCSVDEPVTCSVDCDLYWNEV